MSGWRTWISSSAAPQISIVLRRLQDQGKIHQVRRGWPHWEALYVKEAG